MPQTLMAHTLGDLVRGYQKTEMIPRKWTDLTRNYRNNLFADLTTRILKKITRNSTNFTFSYMVGGYRNGVYDSFFEADSLNRQNLGLTGTATWAMYKTHWALDRREPNFPSSGSSPTMLFDHLKMQEANFWNGVFEDGLEALWTLAPAPNDGTAGQIVPHGIPYSVTKVNATSTVGQNGGVPTNYTTVYGNSRTTYPQLRNYNGTYTTVADNDLGDKMEEMINLMHWEAPKPSADEITLPTDLELRSHRTPWREYGRLLRSQNDNLGPDNGKFRPRPGGAAHMIMGFPWYWEDALTTPFMRDGVTANPCYDVQQPIYALNWKAFQLFAAEDFWMKVDPPLHLDDPHNTTVMWLNSMYNLVNLDPGQSGVLHRA